MWDTVSLIVAVCGPIYAGFFALERVFASERKKDIAAWLKGEKIHGSLNTWPRQFAALFDRVFGEQHWSWKCFFRSCIASLAVMLALSLRWIFLRPDDAATFWNTMLLYPVQNLLIFLTFTVGLNIVTDYVALLACRRLLGVIVSRRASLAASLAFAVLGTLVSMAVYIGISMYGGLVLIALSQTTSVRLSDVNGLFEFMATELLYEGLLLRSTPPNGSMGVYFYSTLVTSVWAWLYFASASSIRAARRLSPVIGFVRYIMDVEARPLECIGVVATAIAGAIILLGSLVSMVVG